MSQSVTGNGAALAGVGAAFAVVHRVRRALGCAGFARLGAKRKYRRHMFAARRDRPRCQPANIGAFQVQPDAANHWFGVTLLKTGRSTLKASRRALVAGAKAFDLFLTKHKFLFELPDVRLLNYLQHCAGGLFGSAHGVAKESEEKARMPAIRLVAHAGAGCQKKCWLRSGSTCRRGAVVLVDGRLGADLAAYVKGASPARKGSASNVSTQAVTTALAMTTRRHAFPRSPQSC